MPIKRSNEPRAALCNKTGVCFAPSSPTYVESNLPGRLKSACQVPHCHFLPIASVKTKSSFGP